MEKTSYEERRENAFKNGKIFHVILCPVCHRAIKPEKLEIDENQEIIQTRYALGGHAIGGFFKKDDEAMKIKELKEKNPILFEKIREVIKKLNFLFEI